MGTIAVGYQESKDPIYLLTGPAKHKQNVTSLMWRVLAYHDNNRVQDARGRVERVGGCGGGQCFSSL